MTRRINRMVGIIFLMLVTFNARLSAEKTGRITGRVVESLYKIPIYNANIVIPGERVGAVSLKDGSYSMTGVPEGIYAVKALFEGYESQAFDSVVVKEALVTKVDFMLNYIDSLPIYDCINGRGRACEIHDEELIPLVQLLKYPLESDLKYLGGEDADLYEQAHEKLFPNTDQDCRPVMPEKGRVVILYLCPGCIEAREAWLKEHADIRAVIEKRREFR